MVYGSEEDDVSASKSLLAVELDDHHLKETLISKFVTKFAKLTQVTSTIMLCNFLGG